MNKNFKILSFLFLFFLWINAPLQAVGGLKAEEVPFEEIKRRGILKIQYAEDSSEISTAVLFKEGKGQLGLGAKHSFEKGGTKFAYLGEEKREIIKVYKSEKDVDLVLFVLSSPFKGADEFPTLPEPSSYPYLYEGYLYGYGSTTSSNHPGSLEGSQGICRKGEVFMTPLSNIEPDAYILKSDEESHEQANDELVSLSTFQEKRFADNPLSTDARDKFNKEILDKGYLSLVKHDLHDDSWLSPVFILPFSPASMLAGDSGGPVISGDNQLYALASNITHTFYPILRVDFLENIVKEKNYKQYFKLVFSGQELSIGFVSGEESILYIGLTNIESFSLFGYLSFRSEILELFSEDVVWYFGRGNSVFFHSLVKIEAKEQNSSYFYNWLKMHLLYDVDCFTSIASHRNWIADMMPIACQYIEEKKQRAEILSKAKHIDYLPKRERKTGQWL